MSHPDRQQNAAAVPSRSVGAPVRFDAIGKSYGTMTAVERVDLDIAAGEFLTLLGPSGSGKTTTLMMLAGFETPTTGHIRVGDRDITHMRPAQRNIGMVFQSYALFPHMTVYDNIAFPLRMRGIAPAEQRRMVERILEVVDLGPLGSRYPRQLSGGQQQRVALARAIVFEPPVLLMDEPLSALDKYLRSHLQSEIKRIQRELGMTVVYVTHDQDEAMTMSDRICVMNHGRIRQIDTPETLYQKPVDVFVAGFLGESNMLDADVRGYEGGFVRLSIGGAPVSVRLGSEPTAGKIRVSVRPEHAFLSSAGRPAQASTPVTIAEVVYVGDHRRYAARLPDGTLVHVKQQVAAQAERFAPGDAAQLHWPLGEIRLFGDGVVLA